MLRKVVSNWSLLALTFAATVLLLPINLHYLGAKGYGTWLVIQASAMYIYLLQLGLPMTVVRTYGEARASNDPARMQTVLVTHLVTNLALTVVAFISIPILLWIMERHFYGDPSLLADARIALPLSIVAIAIGNIAQLPHAILSACQEFVRLNALKTALLIARVAVNLIAIHFYPSLITLALVLLFTSVTELIGFIILAARTEKNLRLRFSAFSFVELRRAFDMSRYVFLLGLGHVLVGQTITLLVGGRLGTEYVPLFTIPIGLLMQFATLIDGIGTVVMPVAVELGKSEQRRAALTDVLLRWSKISSALTFLAATGLLVLAPKAFEIWLGPTMLPAAHVLQISLACMLMYLPVRGAAMPVLIGIGDVARTTTAVLSASVTNIILAYLVIDRFGVVGVAWTFGLTHACLAFYLAAMACGSIGMTLGTYLREVMLKPILGLPITLLAGFAIAHFVRPTNYAQLGLTGLSVATIFAGVWILFVFRNDRHVPVGELSGLLPRPFKSVS